MGKGRKDFRVLAVKIILKNGYLGDIGWLGGDNIKVSML